MQYPSLRFTLLLSSIVATYGVVEKCPGEGPRYGDYKCNHDPTHRVCATLKESGEKTMWGNQDFWGLTHQSDWSNQVGSSAANPGGGWCICMWATARLIAQVGCDNVHLSCASTDVTYVMSSYTDGGVDLKPAKDCLAKKCTQPTATTVVPTKTTWAGSTVQDLHAEFAHIFKSGNRNAASHLWSTFLIDRAPQLSHSTFVTLSSGYCAVSGSPVVPSESKRYGVTLPMVSGGSSMSGFMYFCCWPCACDTADMIQLDTKSITAKDGTEKTYLVAVIGDPCKDPAQLETPYTTTIDGAEKTVTLSSQAPEVTCDGNKLRGASMSDNGFPIVSLFFTSQGSSSSPASSTAVIGPNDGSTSVTGMATACAERKDAGYASGMGVIFRKIASIAPIASIASHYKPLQSLPYVVKSTAILTGANPTQLAEGTKLRTALIKATADALGVPSENIRISSVNRRAATVEFSIQANSQADGDTLAAKMKTVVSDSSSAGLAKKFEAKALIAGTTLNVSITLSGQSQVSKSENMNQNSVAKQDKNQGSVDTQDMNQNSNAKQEPSTGTNEGGWGLPTAAVVGIATVGVLGVACVVYAVIRQQAVGSASAPESTDSAIKDSAKWVSFEESNPELASSSIPELKLELDPESAIESRTSEKQIF